MKIKKLTFSVAGELEYEIPHGTKSIAFKVIGGSVDMRTTTGTSGDEWPMSAGEPEAINERGLCEQTLYFTGTLGAVLHIRRIEEGT